MDNSQKIEEIKDKLKTIFDPEIPVDIYELGLIYDVRLKDKNCEIDMTLTSPNCPEAQSIPNNVRKAVESLGLAPINPYASKVVGGNRPKLRYTHFLNAAFNEFNLEG